MRTWEETVNQYYLIEDRIKTALIFNLSGKAFCILLWCLVTYICNTDVISFSFAKRGYAAHCYDLFAVNFYDRSYHGMVWYIQGWVSPCTATSVWSIVHPLWIFNSAAIPSQLRLNARPTRRRTVVPSYSPFYSVSNVDSAMLAPSIREHWYLTYSPFRSEVDIALCQLHLPENSGT
jgi:hypothetical protein